MFRADTGTGTGSSAELVDGGDDVAREHAAMAGVEGEGHRAKALAVRNDTRHEVLCAHVKGGGV